MKTILQFKNIKVLKQFKFIDKSGEKECLTDEVQDVWVNTFYIIINDKVRFIVSKSNERWYDKILKEKTRRFRLEDSTLFLNKLAIKKKLILKTFILK